MILRRIFRSRRARIVASASVLLLMITLFTLPYWLPVGLTAQRDDLVFRVPGAGKQVFLTIDDGPSTATNQILQVLAKHEVTATFFIICGHVHDPAQLTALRAAGHALGHHMKTTRACSKLTLAEFQHDFDAVDQLLAAADGVRLFRPPSDFGTREQIAYVSSKGYLAVVGTGFPLDHWLENPDVIRRLAEWLTVDGGIIILHDGAERGPRTTAVLDELIPALKQEGFTFGSLAEELSHTKEAE